MKKPAFANWGLILLAIILISPLLNLPRPTNISSIPWRVELFFSIFAVTCFVIYFLSKTIPRYEDPSVIDSPHRPAILFLAGFVLWSAISFAWSRSPTAAVHHTLVWGNYAFVLLFSCFASSRLQGRSKTLYLLGALTCIIGALACFDFLTIQDFSIQEGTLRIRYAKFAELLITFAPLLFAVPIMSKTRRGLFTGLAIASLAWCGAMLSLSKGAFLAGFLGLIVSFLLILSFKATFRKRALLAASVWLAVTLTFQLGFSFLTSIPSTAEYISGSHQSGPNTSNMRIFTWKIARQMFIENPIVGVGGDNFGINVNDARAKYAAVDPDDVDSGIGEDYIFERAHNEIFQIACELGSIGLLLFVGFGGSIAFVLGREIFRRGKHISPLFYGAIGGALAFTASSLVSSFSFRAFQNGLVFMIVLGFAMSYIRTESRSTKIENEAEPAGPQFRWLAVSLATMLAVFSLSKAGSQYVLYAGERARDVHEAVSYFDTASRLDPDNPGAELAAAELLAREQRWEESVPHFRRAIDRGFGVSFLYSYLANAQEKYRDLPAAARTLNEAAAIFPRSTFIRVRTAIVLEKLGRQDDAEAQLSISRTIDKRQTDGWYSVIKEGILKAHLNATAEPENYAAPPDLLPASAIYAYNDEKIKANDP